MSLQMYSTAIIYNASCCKRQLFVAYGDPPGPVVDHSKLQHKYNHGTLQHKANENNIKYDGLRICTF